MRPFESPAGLILLVLEPAGTRGTGICAGARGCSISARASRPRVADPGDLVRMIEAIDRPEDALTLEAMRRVVELDRGVDLGL